MPLIGGVYSGLKYLKTPLSVSGAGAMDDNIETKINSNQQDSIVSIFIMPNEYYSTGTSAVQLSHTVARPSTVNGYSPRNKKLLCYPYVFLNVDCLNDSHIYRWEWFSNDPDTGRKTFYSSCSMTPNPEIALAPVNYNGSSGANNTEQLVMTGFPQCAWIVDTYMAWLAQKSTGETLGLLGQGVSAGAGLLAASTPTGAVVAGVTGALGLAGTIDGMVKEATFGSTSRGNQGGSVNVATRSKGFYFKFMSITEQYAKMLDDYFDLYGYATDRVKVPNRNSRPHWNYVKTRGCKVYGSLPEDARVKIQDIYDKGITFWKNGTEVGNYALNNSV